MSALIAAIIAKLGYFGVALLTFTETIFPPLPSEVIIPLAGLSAQRGAMSFIGVVAAGTLGSMAGNLVWYGLARRLGLARFKPLVDRHGRWLTTDWADIKRGEAWFARHGAAFVFVGRLLPAVRTLVCIPAGFARMPPLPYVFWSSLGTAIWTGALAWAGWTMGENYAALGHLVGWVATAMTGFFAGWYIWRLLRKR